MKRFIANWFEQAMVSPDVNSRLVLLMHGAVSALSILILSVAFIFSHDRTEYTAMAYALVTGGGVANVGRLATKYGDKFKVNTEVKQ